ncbi:hypothetical protein [Mycobacterium alsense]|uniref:hypothetical protein n=1 Tax=Mycobacterium alsense TaxID=324058 RepID=UPI0010425A92|nr:hypothetical protein [Mycobacterium alsense]
MVCLGVTTAVLRLLPDPLTFTSFDEQLHLRTLNDIVASHHLFNANPGLGVSPRYPGLETVTVVFHQVGLPLTVAALAVVLVARVVLVLVLCDTVEHLTGNMRSGGLAVAVYAMSAHFVAFNTMFSYQTLALPLALAAVSFIARARWAANPLPLFAGATVCLLAVAVTHHLTSWLTAAFLALWATAEGGRRARRRIFFGALVAAVATTGWAMIQLEFVRDYFGPMIDDLSSQVNHEHRGAFHDDAGFTTPLWERFFLLYYTAALALAAALMILFYVRSVSLRGRSGGRRWEPGALLVVLAAMIPLLLGARVMPTGSEIADRLGTFLFLGLSLLVARASDRWVRLRRVSNSGSWSHRRLVVVQSLALLLATWVFVGGYLMGSGPAWIRLPGSYLVGADRRSMDSETLAAVRWASDELPPGRLVGAERVPAVLLASQAGLYTVMHDRERDVPELYFADEWGPRQSESARALNLRYLYVDQRSAFDRPHLGSYFYRGEKSGRPGDIPERLRLTQAELKKFDDVRGMSTVYRHGPISIYDLGGLYDPTGRDVPEYRIGWARPKTPEVGVGIQLLTGILAGLALALSARSRAGAAVVERLKSFGTASGPALTFAAGLSAVCAGSTGLLLAHVWFGPFVFLAMAVAVLLVNCRWVMSSFRTTALSIKVASGLRWKKWLTAWAMVAIPAGLAIGLSTAGAYSEDVAKVHSILNDPSAVHVPAYGPNPAGSADGSG